MKKIYLLFSVSLFLSFGSAAQTTHFTENFNNGLASWTSNDLDGDSYAWYNTPLSGTPFDSQGEVAFSESYNGTALSPDNILVSPAINLASATGTISLSYKIGSYRSSYYAEHFSVYVTGSISNMTTVLNSTPIHTMTISEGESLPTYTFDISSFAGDNSVYLVFRHHDTFDQYEVILDDILVQSSGGGGGGGDLKNLSSYNGNIETGLDYTLIANSQRGPLTVGSKIANLSANALSGKTLGVVINDGTSNVYTGSTTFNIAGNDTSFVWVNTNYTPAVNKSYTITCTLGTDDNNANNISTAAFQTQNDYYAHDQSPSQTLGTPATGSSYYFLNAFEIRNAATLYSIDVKLAAGTTANQELRVFLSSSNGYIGEGFKTITASDISGGQYVRIYLDNPALLQAGIAHFVGVGSDALGGALHLAAQNGNEDGASGTLINGTFAQTAKTVAIRMNFGQGCVSYDANASATSAPECNPNNGSIFLDIAVGGQAVSGQNTITWTGTESGTSGANQGNMYTISGLQAGTYDVTLTNNGCTTTLTDIVVGSIPSPVLSINELTPISCFGASDGSISYSTTGDAFGYTFTWEDGSSSLIRTGLGVGTYTINATNGVCALTKSFTFTQPQEIGIVAVKQNVTTCGGNNGQINLTASGGTTSTYIYTWTGPSTGTSGPGFGNTFTINDLTAGNYTINVTNGSCSNSIVVSVSENGAPAVTISETDFISCANGTDGALQVSGTNISAYTFTWSNGSVGTSISNVGAGTYTVTGTNGNCTTVATFELGQPLALVVTGSAGVSTITTTVNGGTPGYTYSWTGPNSFTSTSANLSNLTNLGTYTVTVTDQNGCSDSQSFMLDYIGLEEVAQLNGIKYYPNPASELINFEVNDAVKTIRIVDFTGKLISETSVKNAVETVSLEGLSNGVYFFSLLDEQNKLVLTDKFVVNK
ncbi:MAG: hypothetical protein K0R65_779 [Crocinitomicaceae bacterium]|jgi:hypothetical protein|nr:hypothetical protein [Crocinitomicaceae bacterium]